MNKKIANIISDQELSNHKKLDWINYLKYGDEIDRLLPTLYIGWANVKNHLSAYRPNILEKEIKGTSYRWEFGMNEKMTEHFNGIEDFIQKAPRKFIDNYVHITIDPIIDKIEIPEDVLAKIGTPRGCMYIYKKEIAYIWTFDEGKEGKLYSVFFNAFEYFGLSTEILINALKIGFPIHKEDPDGAIYQQYYRQFPDFDQLKRSIVLFLWR